jgi:tRNA threonylcarbamoyladenosine biosynthesis protein TsaE
MTPIQADAARETAFTRHVELADLEATERLAARLAAEAEVGDVIGLQGPLGVGKTAFARGFIRACFGATEVPSPTFTLVQTYEADDFSIWHFDLYRIAKLEEVHELGLDEALERGIVLIEWPERLGTAMPADWLEIALAPVARSTARRAHLIAHGPRARALLASVCDVTP